MSILLAIPMPLLRMILHMLTTLHLGPFATVMPNIGVVIAWRVRKMVLHTLTIQYLDPFPVAVLEFATAAVPVAPRHLAGPIAEHCP